MADLTRELDPTQIEFGRKHFMLALDSEDSTNGLLGLGVVKALLPVLHGVKIPSIGGTYGPQSLRAFSGVMNDFERPREILVDGAYYSPSHYLLENMIREAVSGGTRATIAGVNDPRILHSMNTGGFFDDINATRRLLVAGSSPEMSRDQKLSLTAAEISIGYKCGGVVCRASDVSKIVSKFKDEMSQKCIVATGISDTHSADRRTVAEAIQAGADIIVLGKDLRTVANPVKYMIEEVFGSLDISDLQTRDKVAKV